MSHDTLRRMKTGGRRGFTLASVVAGVLLFPSGAVWAAPSASGADLSITKSDSPDPATVGENLTYSIAVANGGPAAAAGITVRDDLPAGVTFVSSSPSQGSCSGTTTVVCTLGNLKDGATASVQIVVRATQAGTITNTATVSGNQKDDNQANNEATASTTVSSPSVPWVTIEISVGVDLPHGYQALKARSLTVPNGANVKGILDRAVEEHFILFYTTDEYGRIQCIDGLCAVPRVGVCGAEVFTRWLIHETPGSTRYGLADEGDRFDFAYHNQSSLRC